MVFKEWLSKWDIKLKINASIFEVELTFTDKDKDAAWDLYVEMITRTTTQAFVKEEGNAKAALDSIYSIFGLTRSLLKEHGRDCRGFAKVSIPILNQMIRPFTSKWHQYSLDGTLEYPENYESFMLELRSLQKDLGKYVNLLADMAGVEDMSQLEDVED